LDLDELACALEKDLITIAQARKAFAALSFLLSKIDDGSFFDFARVLEKYFD
jgi:predicted RNA-binding protein associated with RNAse of E/G family